MNHEDWMLHALQLAERGLYSAHPNPRVGCVLVRDGVLVGEGWHRKAGEPHAEIHALEQAGSEARGATAYVTLEPCSHHGKTPPCCDALIRAGVKQVVAAMQDPNPQVSGRGFQRLRDQGVEVLCGVLEDQARHLNAGFIRRMSFGLPYVRLKMAMSLDGRTAMASGESQWITGPAARSAVQRLRARSGAVLTGADTVLCDGARLTLRKSELGLPEDMAGLALLNPPLRVLIDSRERVPADNPFFQTPGALVVSCRARRQPMPTGAEFIETGERNGKVDLLDLFRQLAIRGVNEVLVEGGSTLAGALACADLVDEYQIFVAGLFMGSDARPLLGYPLSTMAEAPRLAIRDVRAVEQDWLMTAVPVSKLKD